MAGGGGTGAGTVHFGTDLDGFVDFAADLSVGREPEHPFVLFGQMTTADPTRSPAGTESAWAYTHVPPDWDAAAVPSTSSGSRRPSSRWRPGSVPACWPGTSSPRAISKRTTEPGQRRDQRRHLVAHQQLFFRPTPAWAGRKLRSQDCSSPAPRRIPAAVCTAPADGMPPGPRWMPTAAPDRRAGGSTARCGAGCCRRAEQRRHRLLARRRAHRPPPGRVHAPMPGRVAHGVSSTLMQESCFCWNSW